MADNNSKSVMKKEVGRPSKFTDDTIQKLKSAYIMGSTDDEACASADLGVSTLHTYFQTYPTFLEQVIRWKQNPILKAKATIYTHLDEVETAQWYLERKKRDEFGNEIQTPPVAIQINFGSPEIAEWGK